MLLRLKIVFWASVLQARSSCSTEDLCSPNERDSDFLSLLQTKEPYLQTRKQGELERESHDCPGGCSKARPPLLAQLENETVYHLNQMELSAQHQDDAPASLAEPDRRGNLSQQSSTPDGKGKMPRIVTGVRQGFFHRVLKLSSKGPPALTDVLLATGKRTLPMNKIDEEAIDKDYDISIVPITYQQGVAVLDVTLLICFSVLAAYSSSDFRNFWILVRGASKEDILRITGSQPKQVEEPGSWSIKMLIGLTAYRFYTGFLTATWLPYLLAMEGQYLWSENQSMFMGCAKLIYGATVLTNPILGLVGDKAVLLSHGIGRRLFVRLGVGLAALGILVCMVASEIMFFYTFMFGIFLWRMGEAINDVTTEALVPELVSAEQFQIASAVKAAMFLVGGLFGYIMLLAAAKVHYSWVYHAYLVGMIVTCIPVLILLDNDAPRIPPGGSRRLQLSFSTQMAECYLAPARAQGGFPRSCLAVFIFSLGTAPMFFLLLITRDVVGIRDEVRLQQHFSLISLMFFISASLAAVMSGAKPRPPSTSPSLQRTGSPDHVQAAEDSSVANSLVSMSYSVFLFAMLCFAIPYIGFLDSLNVRLIVFYALATVFGYAFGLAFAQFQGITWQLLPEGIDLANAMGFNVMSRLLGIGVGNFIAGLILDFYYIDTAPADTIIVNGHMQAEGGYSFAGYILMCTASGVATLIAAILCYSIAQQDRGAKDWSCKTSSLVAEAG